ncbi:hypothetical protein [Dyella acidiphila]|uniref:Uncharacterized protein n=1 Tax=Dyella acidiphila TaxID=2775866 RepID=A0ABR9G9U4_9GAMM|nr:hypothetical protein [Dyella acidiphila]MBE1160804.1 hypothetical protein [Dyella acidiphila]
MHTYPPAVVAILMLAVATIMWRASKYSARGILQRQFKATFDPGGPYIECGVRFVLDDMPAPCAVRTTREGWYMVTPDAMRKWPNWSNNVAFLKQAVFIPWASLDYYRAKSPMSNWVRFDVKGTKATFFVKWDDALSLLQSGGMPLPPEHRQR